MKKYKAKCSFSNAVVGSVEKGQLLDDSETVRYLAKSGYLEEYKTKVVNRKPAKPKKKVTKKASKK